MTKTKIETLTRIYGGAMSERELKILRDIQAFIDFCVENGLSFDSVIGTLVHDVNGIRATGDMYKTGVFSPKVSGYTRIQAEQGQQREMIANDPAMQPGYGKREEAVSAKGDQHGGEAR
jgi:hypothetical protein